MTVARERARKNRRRGSQVTGLNSRPRPSSPSCGVDRPYRKPGTNPREFKSQGGEDAFLNRHFNGTRVGTYLDIGCNDGVDGSNTFYFQQRGWQGVCVEADPAKFLQILPHSSRRDGVNLAIANRSSCLTFARVHDSNNGLSGIASTLDVERARVFGITRINVTAISPLELLGRYYAHVPVLDYASVDVEGAELTIMNAWPFERWCVNAFTIENNFWCSATRSILPALRSILEPRGYRYERRIWVDEVFVRRTLCPRPGPRGRVGPVAGPFARAGCSAPRPLPSRGARNSFTGKIIG